MRNVVAEERGPEALGGSYKEAVKARVIAKWRKKGLQQTVQAMSGGNCDADCKRKRRKGVVKVGCKVMKREDEVEADGGTGRERGGGQWDVEVLSMNCSVLMAARKWVVGVGGTQTDREVPGRLRWHARKAGYQPG